MNGSSKSPAGEFFWFKPLSAAASFPTRGKPDRESRSQKNYAEGWIPARAGITAGVSSRPPTLLRMKRALRDRRIFHHHRRRPNRPRREIAAAIRADAMQARVDTIPAEGAFEGADHRVRGFRRQILVA